MGTNVENSKTNENGYCQLTNINPLTARTIAMEDDTTNCGDHNDNVVEDNNQDDKAWTLLEVQYGLKGTATPSTNEDGNPGDGINLLNETPEELNGGPQ